MKYMFNKRVRHTPEPLKITLRGILALLFLRQQVPLQNLLYSEKESLHKLKKPSVQTNNRVINYFLALHLTFFWKNRFLFSHVIRINYLLKIKSALTLKYL